MKPIQGRLTDTIIGMVVTPEPAEDGSAMFSAERNIRVQAASYITRTSGVVDPLNIDSFSHTFPSMSELGCARVFTASQKKEPQQASVVSSPPPSSSAARPGAALKGPSLVGGFANESTSLSSFDLEYALLEQALKKDSSGTAQTHGDDQSRPERRGGQNVLEPELYFSDILGENGIPCQSLVSDQNQVYGVNETSRGKAGNDQNHEQMDVDLSSALASLVGSDVSTELKEDDKSGIRVRTQVPLRSNGRPEGSHSNLFVKNTVTDGYYIPNGNSAAFRELRTVATMDNVSLQCGSQTTKDIRPGLEDDVKLLGSGSTGEDEAAQSPVSDSSINEAGICNGIGSHPDLYENLNEDIREKVDRLQGIISKMPRRKLRESLARGVSIDDVEPLMCVNRDELAEMLGLGVTTWKMFVHHTLGIPRWPARALKSQQVKEKKLQQKKLEAEQRGEYDVAERVQRELTRMTQAHQRRRKLFRNDVKHRISRVPIRKTTSSTRS